MNFIRACLVASLGLAAAGAALAQPPGPRPKDCPYVGPMPDYMAEQMPNWLRWDTFTFRVKEGDDEKEVVVNGPVCKQDYVEKQGKTDGSVLEYTENYKQALAQAGAEVKLARDGIVTAHMMKDGKETWIQVSGTRDDGYSVREVEVRPFKATLLPPGGNDYRLLGHMPGFVAGPPDKKHFDEREFLTADGSVKIRGAVYIVDYQPPAQQDPQVTAVEILENYRQALTALNAEILRDSPEDISARLDDHGQSVYVFVQQNRIVAVDEKPFQLTVQPPQADAMKDQLEKEGHIALYVNFDFAKATLKPDAAPVIAQIVALMKGNPDLKVSIDGHTDSIGGHDYNVKLSQDRAASVVAAVVAGGIDAGRLTSAGYGPDKPVAPNDTDEGRAKNRRVELVKAS